MIEWHAQARTLRVAFKTIDEIAAVVGKSRAAVAKAVKDVPYTKAPWREKARQMRSQGATIREIELAVDRSHAQVVGACKGILRPTPAKVEHPKQAKPPRQPKAKARKSPAQPRGHWHPEARAMRAAGASLREIAGKFGVSNQTVQLVCQGIVCPVNHNSLAQKIAQGKRFANHVPKLRDKEKRNRLKRERRAAAPTQRPVLTDAELRQRERTRMLRRAITLDNQKRSSVPITLPRLKFLEDAA